MALSERPVDRVARLDDVEHVDGRVEDPLEIEGVLDDSLRMLGKICGNQNLGHFVKPDFVAARLSCRYSQDRPVRHADHIVRHNALG